MLDVGTKDGMIASQFAELGLEVDAIDIRQPDKDIGNVNFKKISVEDFLLQNNKDYDIVVCRHVLHQLKEPKRVIEALNQIADIFFFTCFGSKDEWFTLEHEDVLTMFQSETVRHHSEAFQYGKTYAGDMKYWHINTFVIDNR